MTRVQVLGDKFAIFLSTLCVIHCLATPLLVIVLPSLGSLVALNHETFHEVLLYFVVPVGLVALIAGYRHHRSKGVLFCGLAGLFVLACAALFAHDLVGETEETVMTIAASLLIVFAHLQNFRMRKKHLCANTKEKSHEH